MVYRCLCLVLIIGFSFYESTAEEKNIHKNCNATLHRLADAQMHLVGCMVANSSPAKSCERCFLQHDYMTKKYVDLTSNPTCAKEILNQDRLNIVYNMQKHLVDAWNKGFCDDCFANGTISNETIAFNNFSTIFQDCVNTNKVDTCIKCTVRYGDLNNLYKQMDEAKEGRICFDLQDKMNRTRSLWSKDLNCCHRQYNLTFFIIASSLFAALPIIFYSGMYGYTKRMERNHEVLDADLNTGNASTSAGVQSGTTSHIEEETNQRESSSDEESIDKLKKQRDQNSLHPEKVKTLKDTFKPTSSARTTSSNDFGALIDL